MVKKAILLLLALTLILCGCGKSEEKPKEVVTLPTEESTADIPDTSAADTAESYPESDSVIITQTPDSEEESTSVDRGEEGGYIVDRRSFEGKKICIDPGHGSFDKGYEEAIGPGSTRTKPAFVSGTSGAYQTEAEFNLTMAYTLKELLEAQGAQVYMTRTTEKAELSNIGRAQYANELECDMVVRIHADGSENSSVNGISVLIPGRNQFVTDDDLISASHDAGYYVLAELVRFTGSPSRGLIERTDLTGFNWTEVPCILVECGFMTNAEDDRKLADPTYRNKLAWGITSGLLTYYETV